MIEATGTADPTMIEAPEPEKMLEAETPQVEGAPAEPVKAELPLEDVIAKIREHYEDSDRSNEEVNILAGSLIYLGETRLRQLYKEIEELDQRKVTNQPWAGSEPQRPPQDNR